MFLGIETRSANFVKRKQKNMDYYFLSLWPAIFSYQYNFILAYSINPAKRLPPPPPPLSHPHKQVTTIKYYITAFIAVIFSDKDVYV